MVPALVGALVSIIVTVIATVGPLRGAKHQRELANLEADLLTKVPVTSPTHRRLSEILNDRVIDWHLEQNQAPRRLFLRSLVFLGFGIQVLALMILFYSDGQRGQVIVTDMVSGLVPYASTGTLVGAAIALVPFTFMLGQDFRSARDRSRARRRAR